MRTLEERLHAHIEYLTGPVKDYKGDLLPNGCWRWTGSLNQHGYGAITVNVPGGSRRPRLAHRVAYELHRAPIPEGLDLDHLCHNRWCVNPSHLEPVTRAENLRRGAVARGLSPTCRNGHPRDEENLAIWDGHTKCRACERVKNHRYYMRKKRRLEQAERQAQSAQTRQEDLPHAA